MPLEVVRHCAMFLPRSLWLARLLRKTARVETGGRKLFVILSSDTEYDPPSGSDGWNSRSTSSLLDGLPRILDLCDHFRAPATFFSEGRLVETMPDLFRELSGRHEIGCHSYAHEWLGTDPPPRWIPRRESMRVLSSDEKLRIIRRAIKAIEGVIGRPPKSFKAPFNSIDHPATLSLLDALGFDADSSLPCYDNQSFVHPLRPAPVRHVSTRALWSEGKTRLIEVPFLIRPRPLPLHPFNARESIVDTIRRGMNLAMESVDVQCKIDAIVGRELSVAHIGSHPWEFSEVGPWGGTGISNVRNLKAFLERLEEIYDVEFLTVTEFVRKWENDLCRYHSNSRIL